MSALSRSAIINKLRANELVISPILKAGQIGASSVDLRMGTVALMARAGAQSHVDPAAYLPNPKLGKHGVIQDRQQKHERFDIPYGKSFLLHPGSLVLVPTLEWVKMPENLQGIVTARSSWAREGLNIATATIINPSYQGIITLELANFGDIPIRLTPGLRLAQLALYELTRNDVEIEGTYAKLQSKGQFDMSFEPSAGDIAKGDELFAELGEGKMSNNYP